ncbi:MAG: hypothetical protein PHC63_08770 [Candidatus Bathyarchaeota archaeon]|jgi:hypothetical protein|nr:hypothetical protein [Candidatus Bathyarchaeota archaeon]NLD65341.1 hypothetical protein [Thermoproteota archaeon]
MPEAIQAYLLALKKHVNPVSQPANFLGDYAISICTIGLSGKKRDVESRENLIGMF